MKASEFDRLLEERLSKTRAVLATKAGEYASDKDRLHNFKVSAEVMRSTPEGALLGFWTKHLVSIIDMIVDIEDNFCVEYARWDEKIGDAINYLVLLEALVVERLQRETIA